MKRTRAAWWFVAPALVVIAVFFVLLVIAALIVSFVVPYPVGWLVDRFGARIVLIAGFILVALVEAHGVTTRNLRYPLFAETLPVGTSRGVSNEPLDAEVGVQLQRGVLVVTRHFPRG